MRSVFFCIIAAAALATGAQAEISLKGGGLSLNIASPAAGPGFSAGGAGSQTLSVTDAGDYLAARAWAQATARSLLPARR